MEKRTKNWFELRSHNEAEEQKKSNESSLTLRWLVFPSKSPRADKKTACPGKNV